jgi:hypothetical protein
MANNAFDRTILNPLEKALADDHDQAQAQSDRTIREVLKSLYAPRTSTLVDSSSFVSGFIGDGYKVRAAAAPDMTVTVSEGIGFYENPADVPANIGGIIGLDDRCTYKPMVLATPYAFPVPVAPGIGHERWDIIEVKVDRRAENPLVREAFTTGPPPAFVPSLINKTLTFAHDGRAGYATAPAGSTYNLSYRVGIEGLVGATTADVATTGYVKIAEVYVGTGVTWIGPNCINDCRRMLFPGGIGHLAMSWVQRTGTDVPLSMLVQGPPGVEATVYAKGPLGGTIFVKSGGRMTGLLPGAVHFYPTAWGSAVVWPGLSAQLDATVQGQLADVSKVSNAMAWGVGQWVSSWVYRLYNGAAAGIGAVQANTEAGIVSADLSLTY